MPRQNRCGLCHVLAFSPATMLVVDPHRRHLRGKALIGDPIADRIAGTALLDPAFAEQAHR